MSDFDQTRSALCTQHVDAKPSRKFPTPVRKSSQPSRPPLPRSSHSHISLRHPQSHASDGTQRDRGGEAISAGLLAPSVALGRRRAPARCSRRQPAQVRCVRCLHVVVVVILLVVRWFSISIGIGGCNFSFICVFLMMLRGIGKARSISVLHAAKQLRARGRASPPDLAGRRILASRADCCA